MGSLLAQTYLHTLLSLAQNHLHSLLSLTQTLLLQGPNQILAAQTLQTQTQTFHLSNAGNPSGNCAAVSPSGTSPDSPITPPPASSDSRHDHRQSISPLQPQSSYMSRHIELVKPVEPVAPSHEPAAPHQHSMSLSGTALLIMISGLHVKAALSSTRPTSFLSRQSPSPITGPSLSPAPSFTSLLLRQLKDRKPSTPGDRSSPETYTFSLELPFIVVSHPFSRRFGRGRITRRDG